MKEKPVTFTPLEILALSGACPEALVWVWKRMEKKHWTWQECWDRCPRGDWMVWLLSRTVWIGPTLKLKLFHEFFYTRDKWLRKKWHKSKSNDPWYGKGHANFIRRFYPVSPYLDRMLDTALSIAECPIAEAKKTAQEAVAILPELASQRSQSAKKALKTRKKKGACSSSRT